MRKIFTSLARLTRSDNARKEFGPGTQNNSLQQAGLINPNGSKLIFATFNAAFGKLFESRSGKFVVVNNAGKLQIGEFTSLGSNSMFHKSSAFIEQMQESEWSAFKTATTIQQSDTLEGIHLKCLQWLINGGNEP